MRVVVGLGLLFVLLASGGCSMKQPQSAQEFRQMLPGSMFGKQETVTVDRSYSKVIDTFRKRAGKCLNVVVQRDVVNRYGQVVNTTNITYTPTLNVGKSRAELYLQQLPEGSATFVVGEMPEKGFYFFVADAIHAGKNKTRLDLYYSSYGADTLSRAVKNWAKGDNLGCPDLTQG